MILSYFIIIFSILINYGIIFLRFKKFGGFMDIKFYLIGSILLIIGYTLCSFLKKPFSQYKTYLEKNYFQNKKINRKDNDKINVIYYSILLFLMILMITHSIYIKFIPYSRTVFLQPSQTILKFGLPILYFLLGILFSNGKKLIYYFLDYYFNILKTLILTGLTINLLVLQKNCIPFLMIGLTLLNTFIIIHYYFTSKSMRKNMKNWEFILHFSWLLITNFLNSFILIYNIWNI